MSSNREFILTIWKLQPGTERVHTSVFALHTSNDHPSSKSTKRFNDAKSSSSAMHANSSISLEKFLYLYFMLCCVVLCFVECADGSINTLLLCLCAFFYYFFGAMTPKSIASTNSTTSLRAACVVSSIVLIWLWLWNLTHSHSLTPR